MKRFFIVSLLLAFLLLSGCSIFYTEDLYCLPRAPEDHYDLQEALTGVLEEGYSYHAPAAGANRETVQLKDLDSDGTDEAVAFFRSNSDGAVVCYIFSERDGAYETAAVIDCAGSGVASVEYADLDGSGNLELLLACQVSQTVTQALQVCQYSGGSALTLETIPCSRYTLSSLGTQGRCYLMCFVDNGSEAVSVGCYRLLEGVLTKETELTLSASQQELRDIREIRLEDGSGALAVTSEQEDGRRSYDILTLLEEQVTRVESDVLQWDSTRGDTLYPQDVDGDGKTEIPQAQTMAPYDEGSAAQSLVLWYGISSQGSPLQKAVTYFDFGGEWYLQLPDSWVDRVLAKQSDTATAVSSVGQTIFYRLDENGKAGQELLTIYTLRGSSQQDYAEEQGLSVLYSNAEVLYAARINDSAELWEGTVTMNQVSDGFHPLEQ